MLNIRDPKLVQGTLQSIPISKLMFRISTHVDFRTRDHGSPSAQPPQSDYNNTEHSVENEQGGPTKSVGEYYCNVL